MKAISCIALTLLLVGCANPQVVAPSTSTRSEVQASKDVTVAKLNTNKTDWNHRVFYEIYVNSFFDSNGDGHGDLNGITKKLDYLKDLGIGGIWLMPITPSPSYHKYDVTNYLGVDPDYGTIQDLKKLTDEAHKRGIKVTMDLVINHTSSEHPWFLEGSKDKNSKYHNYYVWANDQTDLNEKGSWGQQLWYKNPNGEGYYYSTFWSGMPDLNYDNPEVRTKMIEAGKFWLAQGIDGFRLDAAMHIYPGQTSEGADKNYKWWTEFRTALEAVNPDVYLTGEIWTGSEVIAPYFRVLSSAFNFPLADTIIHSVASGLDTGIASTASETNLLYQTYNPKEIDSPFLTNHDQPRTLTSIGGDMEKAKVAAAILLTLPGDPYLYYGEEIGMKGDKPDEQIREPFLWYQKGGSGETTWEKSEANPQGSVSVEQEEGDPNSLLSFYKKWIHLRNLHEALYEGTIEDLKPDNKELVAYKRTSKNETLIVVHNLSDQSQTLDLSGKGLSSLTLLLSGEGAAVVNGMKVTIPKKSSVILK